MQGNWFSTVAFLMWPLVAMYCYKTMPVAKASVWTILGGMLLLPSSIAIKFPMVPPIDKTLIPNMCALIGCWVLAPRPEKLLVRSRAVDILIAIYFISPLITASLNNDPIEIGGRTLPGVGAYDGISTVLSQLWIFLPFFVGRLYFRQREHIETILTALVAAGLFYSLLMLFEIRMSPQLSHWIYGYFPSSFSTEVRYGGYRPVVFFPNGLELAFFAATSVLAAVALWRTRIRIRQFPPAAVLAYLAVILVLCKSAGALLYGLFGGALMALTRPRFQMRIAMVLVTIGLVYPALRANKVFPTAGLVDTIRLFNDDRASSLAFRFDQEDRLLSHAQERIIFGWGRYSRSRVFSEYTGNDESVTDGMWIITLGSFGIVGFIAQFGLLALSVFRAAPLVRMASSERDHIIIAALVLIMALTVVEQLPNAGITPWSWLLAGTLVGRSELIQTARKNASLHRTQIARERQSRVIKVEG